MGLNSDYPVEYRAWTQMRNRCNNKNSPTYKYYGARGISVCKEWDTPNSIQGFILFLAHISPKQDKKMALERIDNDGNYAPGNVRWATRSEQNKNRRILKANRTLTAFGKVFGLREWERETGISTDTIRQRLNKGLSPEDALSTDRIRKKIGPGKTVLNFTVLKEIRGQKNLTGGIFLCKCLCGKEFKIRYENLINPRRYCDSFCGLRGQR